MKTAIPSLQPIESILRAAPVKAGCQCIGMIQPKTEKESTIMKPTPTNRFAALALAIRLSLAALAAILCMGSAHAASYTWIGGTSSDFTTGSNWDGGAWAQWSDYHFATSSTNGTVTINGYFGIDSLNLQSGLTTDIVINSTTTNPVIMGVGVDNGNPLALISIAADSRDLTINGDYIANGEVTWDVGAGRTLTLNGPLNNWNSAASLIKNGEGSAVLTQMSNYTGGTTVNGGTLSLADGDWMTGNPYNNPGGATGAITVGSGATLSTSAGVTEIKNGLTLNGGTISSRGINSATNGNLMLASNITADNSATSLITSEIRLDEFDRSIDVSNGGTLTISGGIGYFWPWGGNLGIIKTGEGTLKLSGANTYGGGTTVNSGTLSLAAAGALPSGGGVAIGAGGKLSNDAPSGTSFALNGLTLTGGELAATSTPDTSLGNFYLNGDVTVSGSTRSTISADLRVVSNQTRDFNVGSTGDPSGVDLLISGKLGHQNNVAWGYATKSGSGTMKLSGTNEIGGMTVNAGRLILEDNAIGWTFPAQGLTNNSQLEFSVTSGSRSSGASISGTGTLFKTGSGTLTLSGGNSYSGGTTINEGTVIASGVGSGAVTIALGATLSTTSASSTGLAALYYNNGSINQDNIASLPALLNHFGANSPAPSLVNTGTSMNFAGDGSGFPSPYNSGASNFEAFYSGKVNIGTAGTYTFNTSSDDGSMLFIDGVAVVTNNFGQGYPGSTKSGTISLTTGMHDIVIAYNQGGGGYGMNAQMSGANDANMVDITTGNASITPDLVVGSLAGAGNVVLSTGNLITGIDNSSTNFSGVISGIGSVTKFGPGVQTLSGTNTYSGVTTLQSGVLNVATFSDYGVAGGLGNRASDGSGDVGILFRGGTLQYTGSTAQTTNRAIRISTLGGATIDASGSIPSATLSFTATSSPDFFENPGNRTLTLTGSNTGDNTFAMAIGEAFGTTSVVKSGTGKWVLTGANTYSGGTTVDGGRLVFQDSTAGGHNYAANTGATLEFNVTTGNKQLNGGSITGGGTLVKSGTGQLWLGANGSPQTVAMSSGGLIDVQGGLMRNEYGSSGWGGNLADMNVAGGAYLDLWDGDITVDALTGSGTVNKAWSGTHTLTVGVDNGSGTFSGTISNLGDAGGGYSGAGGGTLNLVKSGTGTQTLSGAISYTGATTISSGTLQVSGQSYFNVGRTTTVASGAVFELNNSNNTFTSLMPVSTVTGTGTFRLSGSSTINQDLNGTVGTRLTFAMDAGGLIDLQDTSKLTNGGWKELDWTNNKADMNIASGATFDIWDGLEVKIDALTGSGSVVKGHGGGDSTLLTVGVNNGSGTFSGNMTITAGQFSFTKVGTGTQTLSGSNSYTGLTTVTAGTLAFDVSETLLGGLNIATSGTAVLTAHTGGAANVKVLDITGLTISGTTAFVGGADKGGDLSGFGGSPYSPAPVPEPGTIGLIGLGIFAMMALRRRPSK